MDSIASIDFSINSTCVGILSSDGYSWYHFGREKTSYFDLGTDRFTRILFPKRTKGEDYCSTERQKLWDSHTLCSSILDVLKEAKVSAVAFEGHSFNSKGNSLLELVAYQFLLRNMIKNSLNMPTEMMFFYPPITVKSFAGGAKFKKKDMLMRFLDVEDPNLKDNPVFVRISSSPDKVIKGEEVVKPVDDLVDSYWILKKLQQDV
jgi:hypothetical protein